jgi:hypothetical protein
VAGYVSTIWIKQGELGSQVMQEALTYFQRTAGGVTVNPIATDTVYRNTDGTGGQTTSYVYTWYSGTAREQSMTIAYPIASSGRVPQSPSSAAARLDRR